MSYISKENPYTPKDNFLYWNKALYINRTCTCIILQVQPGDVLFIGAYSHGESGVAVPYDIGDPAICGTSYKATFHYDPPVITNVTTMSECWMLSLKLDLKKNIMSTLTFGVLNCFQETHFVSYIHIGMKGLATILLRGRQRDPFLIVE